MSKSTVFADGQGISSKYSGGVSTSSCPDVCKTPSKNKPVPYTNIAKSADIADGPKSVKTDGGMPANEVCCYAKSTGDEPGSGKGVSSGTVADKATFLTVSNTVFFEGKGVGRNADIMLHNNGNTDGINADSNKPAPDADTPEADMAPDDFVIKVVEHLSWNSWKEDKKCYLLGHRDNTPVKDIECTITLPDGSKIKKATDVDGLITIKDVKNTGTCTVEWKCSDSRLNNSYWWYYEQMTPIRLHGEIYPNDPLNPASYIEKNPAIPEIFPPRLPMDKDKYTGAPISWKIEGLAGGRVHLLSIYRPPVIMDSHMHVMSGNCATLLTVASDFRAVYYNTVAMKGARWFLEWLAPILGPMTMPKRKNDGVPRQRLEVEAKLDKVCPEISDNNIRDAIKIAKKCTYVIAGEFIKLRQGKVLDEFQKLSAYTHCNLVMPCVAHTMDMEYAHLDGYFGIKIYNGLYEKDKEGNLKLIDYWFPKHARTEDRDYEIYDYSEASPENNVKHDGISKDDFKKLKKIADGSATGNYQPNFYVLEDSTTGSEASQSSPFSKGGLKGDLYYSRNPTYHEAVPVRTKGLPASYYHIQKGGQAGVRIRCKLFVMPDSEVKRYEDWDNQLRYTKNAILANPLKLLSTFHYDPRRWQAAGGHEEAFREVGDKGLFLGFKIYTAQGYRPWDIYRLPILKDFYKRCEKEKIPVMNHCTPQGAHTIDWDEYEEFYHPNDDLDPYDIKGKEARQNTARYRKDPAVRDAGDKTPDSYFKTHFISPKAWIPVLEANPDLSLCLAHFGGNKALGRKWGEEIIELMKTYPNLHADISSSFINSDFRDYFRGVITDGKNEHIKNRILFGSDWYMIVANDDGYPREYYEYCSTAKATLDTYDTSLWPRFSLVNPIRFYRLDDNKQLKRIAENIIEARKKTISFKVKTVNSKGKTVIVDETLKPLITKKVLEIRKEVEMIRRVREIHENYWKTGAFNMKGCP